MTTQHRLSTQNEVLFLTFFQLPSRQERLTASLSVLIIIRTPMIAVFCDVPTLHLPSISRTVLRAHESKAFIEPPV